MEHSLIVRVYTHPLSDPYHTGNDKLRHLFDFNKRHPAIARDGQLSMPAEIRNLDSMPEGSLKSNLIFIDLTWLTMDRELL